MDFILYLLFTTDDKEDDMKHQNSYKDKIEENLEKVKFRYNLFNFLFEAGFNPCSDGRRFCHDNHLQDLLIAQLGYISQGFSVAQLSPTII